MKKSVKLTAAIAIAAAMACTPFPTFASPAPNSTGNTAGYADEILGGWTVNKGFLSMSKNPEAKAAFDKAVDGLDGVKYDAIALMGTQVVAGTNYAVLCRSTVVYPDALPEIKIMYIYEDLEGNAEITGFQTIIGELCEGGFAANKGNLAPSKNKEVFTAYKTAIGGLTGAAYNQAAYLGSQVVAGNNYLILCRSKASYPNAPYKWSLVTVNRDLNGNASLVDIATLELGNTDIE